MSEKIEKTEEKKETAQSAAASTSMSSMTARYKDTYSRTRDHRSAVRAYCGNNVWAQENAKATGNW